MAGLTKSEQRARARLSYYMWKLSEDEEIEITLRERIPEAWRVLANDLDVAEKKVKLTLRLDESIAKFYRALGPGYQRQVNDILGSYAQMKILKALDDEAYFTDGRFHALVADHKARQLEREAKKAGE